MRSPQAASHSGYMLTIDLPVARNVRMVDMAEFEMAMREASAPTQRQPPATPFSTTRHVVAARRPVASDYPANHSENGYQAAEFDPAGDDYRLTRLLGLADEMQGRHERARSICLDL